MSKDRTQTDESLAVMAARSEALRKLDAVLCKAVHGTSGTIGHATLTHGDVCGSSSPGPRKRGRDW